MMYDEGLGDRANGRSETKGRRDEGTEKGVVNLKVLKFQVLKFQV